MPKQEKYSLAWHAGSSAQIELFNPPEGGEGLYQIKYTPPFRTTIRPPIANMFVGPKEIDQVGQRLNKLVATIGGRGGVGAAPQPEAASNNLVQLGKLLYSYSIPHYMRTAINTTDLFLEFGLEEPLLEYPWELMHDGTDFLCLKHFIGRFVNGTEQIPAANRPTELYEFNKPLDTLSVLLIVVPDPLPRADGQQYEKLPQANAEADAIIEALADDPNINLTLRKGSQATIWNISEDLSRGGFHIVHFCGHAKFDEKHPRQSSLILHDVDLTTGSLYASIREKPPVPIFCFINACETAKTNVGGGNIEENAQLNVFGLARALLETGTYLLGTRWKVSDTAAKHFAKQFYTSLLKESKPLGESIRDARIACKKAVPEDDFAWASYILYGDPRVVLSKK